MKEYIDRLNTSLIIGLSLSKHMYTMQINLSYKYFYIT